MSEVKADKLDELKKLNTKFFELYGDLFEGREIMGSKAAYDFFALKIFEQYKAEYEAFKIKADTIDKPLLYAAKVRHNELVPRRRFFFFRNRARKVIDCEVLTVIEKEFRERKAALDRLIAALENADDISKRTDVFDREPSIDGVNKGETAAQTATDGANTSEVARKNADKVNTDGQSG